MTPMEEANLAFATAMAIWERSLKRRDLDERARVVGAILAYQSQLDALAIKAGRFGDHVTGGDEEGNG